MRNCSTSATKRNEAPARAAGRVVTVLLLVFVLIQVVGVAAAQALIVPRFVDIFEDFDAELPALTILLLELPRVAVVLCLLLWAVGLIAAEMLIRPFLPRVLIHGLSLLLISTATVLMIFGLFLPLVRLIESV